MPKKAISVPAPKAKALDSSFIEHTWDVEQIQENFKTSRINVRFPDKSRGLSKADADDLLAKNGPNVLPRPKEMSDLELFARQFLNMLWILLFVAAILTFCSYLADPSDMTGFWVAVILVVMIFIMCCVSWYQEREARKVVRGFENLLPEVCTVIRDGIERQISAHDIVVGDIIKIQSGIRVPADARILQCSQLKLETSSITGEAEPIDYQYEEVPEKVNIFESKNVAFNSSLCVDGEGVAVVIRTGVNTVIGQIAALTTGQPTKKSRLEMQLKKFVKFISFAAIAVGTFSFIVGGYIHNWHGLLMIVATSYAVCAVCMIPEGLAATVTSVLTVVARRLEKKQVYIKRLDIVEALGSASIIASDKTGTLTKNVMTVTDVWYNDEVVSGPPTGGELNETVTSKKSIDRFTSPMSDILVSMVVCNKAEFTKDDQEQATIRIDGPGYKNTLTAPHNTMHTISKNQDTYSRGQTTFTKALKHHPKLDFSAINQTSVTHTIHKTLQNTLLPFTSFNKFAAKRPALGTPSDVAMLKYAAQVIDVPILRMNYKPVFEIPFNSKRKWQLVIVKKKDLRDGTFRYKLIMKGASEILIKKCSKIMNNKGEEVELDEEAMDLFQKSYERFGENGRRVIGFIQTEFVASANIDFNEKIQNYPQEGLTFVGTCAIMDPPRDETPGAIKQCKDAGIKVFMVTGDHHTTAKAIAKQIGLIDDRIGRPRDWEVVHGEDMSKLTDKDWDRLVTRNALVFSRTTPEQKLMIVEECQKRKQIIAMTGDGVNDAPALKKSDIGVGMGSGSDVAKQAADIILMDDNFAAIVNAIFEGRLMFENIKKLLVYVLVHAFPEAWSVFLYYCFGMPWGMTSLQILSIDLGTEIPPGIAMCKEPAESDIMKRPPRRINKYVVTKALLAYDYLYTPHVQVLACFLSYMCVFWSYGIGVGDLWMSAMDHWHPAGKNFTTSTGLTFSVEEQLYIGRQATSAWQVGIVFGQVVHLFSARTLRESMFRHGFFSNPSSLWAIAVEMAMLLLFVYCPGVNDFLGGAPVPIQCWIVVGAFGVFIFAYNEVRKYFIRKNQHNAIVKCFKF